jgi:hypothetical protein
VGVYGRCRHYRIKTKKGLPFPASPLFDLTASYGTVIFLLLEKLLPVLSQAFTIMKCGPEPIGTSVSINALGEWNTSLKSR